MFAVVKVRHELDARGDEQRLVLRPTRLPWAVEKKALHPDLLHALRAYFATPTREPIQYMISSGEIDGMIGDGDPTIRLALTRIAPSVYYRPEITHEITVLRLLDRYGIRDEIAAWLDIDDSRPVLNPVIAPDILGELL